MRQGSNVQSVHNLFCDWRTAASARALSSVAFTLIIFFFFDLFHCTYLDLAYLDQYVLLSS